MAVFQRYLGLGVESSYGVAVSPTLLLDMASENLELKKPIDFYRPARTIAPDRSVSEVRTVSGAADTLFGFEKLGHILKRLIATPTTTSLGSGAYQHVFRPTVRVEPASFTVDVHRDFQRHRYTGAVPYTARCSIGSLEHWGLSMAWLAADESLDSSASVSDTDFETPVWTVDPAGSGATNGAFSISLTDGVTTSAARATSLDLELEWSRILRMPERSATAVGFYTKGPVKAKGRMRWLYDGDLAWLYDAYRDQTDIEATVEWNGAVIGGGFYRQIQYHLPRLRITGRTPTVRGAGRDNIDQEVAFEALHSSADGYHFQVQLTNTTSSY